MSPNLPHPFDDFLGHFLGVAEQHHGRRRHSDKTFKAGSADDAAFMMENAYRFYGREAARRIWTERSLSIPWVLHPPPCQPARKVALRQRLRSADDAAFMMENAYRFWGRARKVALETVGYSRSHAVTGAAAAALWAPAPVAMGNGRAAGPRWLGQLRLGRLGLANPRAATGSPGGGDQGGQAASLLRGGGAAAAALVGGQRRLP